MVSTRRTPVAAPLAAPEDACQRAQAKYTQPIPRARKLIIPFSRQTQAAQQLILNWIRNNKPDDVIAKFGPLDKLKWSDDLLHYVATEIMPFNKICQHLAPLQLAVGRVWDENKCARCGVELEDSPARLALARLTKALVARGHDEEPTKSRLEAWRAC